LMTMMWIDVRAERCTLPTTAKKQRGIETKLTSIDSRIRNWLTMQLPMDSMEAQIQMKPKAANKRGQTKTPMEIMTTLLPWEDAPALQVPQGGPKKVAASCRVMGFKVTVTAPTLVCIPGAWSLCMWMSVFKF
jgi:hypothetical protein